MARPEWIEVGRVVRPHGVRGEVRVLPRTDNPERLAEGSLLYARRSRVGRTDRPAESRLSLTVAQVRGGAELPIVTFREIGSRSAAEDLKGFVLEVSSKELPPLEDDEFYPFDLEELVVKDGKGMVVGRVAEVIDSPAHGLLRVELHSGVEVLVPFVSEAVPEVVLEKGYLRVEPRFLRTDGGAAEPAGQGADSGERRDDGSDRW